MSHVGRPYDKKTKTLTVKQDEAVDAVVGYLQRKLRIKFAIPKFHVFQNEGIEDVDTSVNWLIHDLRDRKIGGIYLPNTRWFSVSTCILIHLLLKCCHDLFRMCCQLVGACNVQRLQSACVVRLCLKLYILWVKGHSSTSSVCFTYIHYL